LQSAACYLPSEAVECLGTGKRSGCRGTSGEHQQGERVGARSGRCVGWLLYCTWYQSAVALVRAGKRHGIDTDTQTQTFSKGGMTYCLIVFCLFVHATRERLFPPHHYHHHHHHHHHRLHYPALTAPQQLICEKSQIEPLRNVLTKDGDDDVCCSQ